VLQAQAFGMQRSQQVFFLLRGAISSILKRGLDEESIDVIFLNTTILVALILIGCIYLFKSA